MYPQRKIPGKPFYQLLFERKAKGRHLIYGLIRINGLFLTLMNQVDKQNGARYPRNDKNILLSCVEVTEDTSCIMCSSVILNLFFSFFWIFFFQTFSFLFLSSFSFFFFFASLNWVFAQHFFSATEVNRFAGTKAEQNLIVYWHFLFSHYIYYI